MQNDCSAHIGSDNTGIYKLLSKHRLESSFRKAYLLRLNLKSNHPKSPHFEDRKIDINADFDFKYVSKCELEAALKRVRREKKKLRDEENWNHFLTSKREKDVDGMIEKKSSNFLFASEIANCVKCGLSTPTESFIAQASKCQEASSYGITVNLDTKERNSSHILNKSSEEDNQSLHQLGPGATKRLQDLLSTVRKMTSVLLSPCLGTDFEDEHVERAIKRSLEFDAMFTRNHLYEIQRLIKDIKQMLTGKTVSAVELENKISATLKSVVQALQVYTKHVSKGSRVKYQQVFPIFQCITTTLTVVENLCGQRLFPLRQELEVSCSYLKQLLLEMSATETKSVTTVSHKTTKVRLKHKPSSDLSMYSRRQRDWRRKTASLARTRFGPPATKKQSKQSECTRRKDACDGLRSTSSERDIVGSNTNNKVPSKDGASSTELPFRSATRAVPEEHVTTMMEMIPHEEPLVTKLRSQEDSCTRKLNSRRENSSNVQLVCVRERPESRKSISATDENGQSVNIENNNTLSIEDDVLAESLKYKKQVNDYQASSQLYKDGKALGIIDRLSSNFLKEMIIDFQQNEMDQVIRTLYNLEFE